MNRDAFYAAVEKAHDAGFAVPDADDIADALWSDVQSALATARAEGKAEGVREGRLAGLREAGELCENAVVQTIRERRDWPHLPPFGNGGVNITNGMDSVDYIHMGRTDDPELEAEFWARGETIRERDEAAEREASNG